MNRDIAVCSIEETSHFHFSFLLGGNDIAAREVLVVENLADQPFGDQVLHQHLIDGGPADVRVERLLADGEETVECSLELLVLLVRGQVCSAW